MGEERKTPEVPAGVKIESTKRGHGIALRVHKPTDVMNRLAQMLADNPPGTKLSEIVGIPEKRKTKKRKVNK